MTTLAMHLTIRTLDEMERILAAQVSGTFAKFTGPSRRDELNAAGFAEFPPAHGGYWYATETKYARDDLAAGLEVRWWPTWYLAGRGPSREELLELASAALAR